ncbi:MAG TPA: ribosome silencing factor [Burkholderiaceae bacterium]|nr:ribosome silencing factor [Burkholderiaceae bacterium]
MAPQPPPELAPTPPLRDIRKLQRAIVDGLEDVKAQDIVVFNTEHLSPLFERVIIASGTSNRQTKALASSVRDKVRGQGGTVLATEGADNGEWIIVDCGAAVAHILQPALRHYYHLEELWGGKPVNMKLATVARGLVKASEPEPDGDDEDGEAPVPRAPARRPAAAKRSTSAPKAAGAAKPAKKVAKKAAKTAGRAPVTVVVPPPRAAKKAAKNAAKKATTRRAAPPAAAKKAPARKAAGKTAARTPARSAAPARKAASKNTR